MTKFDFKVLLMVTFRREGTRNRVVRLWQHSKNATRPLQPIHLFVGEEFGQVKNRMLLSQNQTLPGSLLVGEPCTFYIADNIHDYGGLMARGPSLFFCSKGGVTCICFVSVMDTQILITWRLWESCWKTKALNNKNNGCSQPKTILEEIGPSLNLSFESFKHYFFN